MPGAIVEKSINRFIAASPFRITDHNVLYRRFCQIHQNSQIFPETGNVVRHGFQPVHNPVFCLHTNQMCLLHDFPGIHANFPGIRTNIPGIRTNLFCLHTNILVLHANISGIRTNVFLIRTNVHGMRTNVPGIQTNKNPFQGFSTPNRGRFTLFKPEMPGVRWNGIKLESFEP